MKILGISGKRGTGKTTLANKLGDYGYVRLSLAGPIKEYCKRDFGLTDNQVYGVDKETPTGYTRTDGSPLTARDIMIRCGVYYRSIDPLYFCKIAHKKMLTIPEDKFVIDDIRFANEVDYFKKLGAKFIRLDREEAFNPFKAALDDLSENELDKFRDWDFLLISSLNRMPDDLRKFADYIETHV